MCDASKKEKAIAGKINSFSDQMTAQATEIFGDDNAIFNGMKNSYDKTVQAGPNQHGFSQAELNEKNAAAITNNSNQFRNVAGAVKAGRAGYGGGNTVDTSGIGSQQDLGVAQAAAANTANDLGTIQAQDYDTGRHNYEFAAENEQQLGKTFDNLAPLDSVAQKGQQASLQEQQSLDAASGWWKAPVMGLVTGAASALTGGLTSGLMSKIPGMGSVPKNMGTSTNMGSQTSS